MTVTAERLTEINDAKRAECGHTGSGCSWCWLTAEEVVKQPYPVRLAEALDLDHILTEVGFPRPPRAVAIVHPARTYGIQILDSAVGTWELWLPAEGQDYELHRGPMWADPHELSRYPHRPAWLAAGGERREVAEHFTTFMRAQGLPG